MVVCTDEATACTDGWLTERLNGELNRARQRVNRTEQIRVWKETKEPDKEAMVLNGRGNVYTFGKV